MYPDLHIVVAAVNEFLVSVLKQCWAKDDSVLFQTLIHLHLLNNMKMRYHLGKKYMYSNYKELHQKGRDIYIHVCWMATESYSNRLHVLKGKVLKSHFFKLAYAYQDQLS